LQDAAAAVHAEGGEYLAVAGDVSCAADVANIVEQGYRHFGRIDILHNNVGITGSGQLLEQTEEDWDRVFAINVRSNFLLAKAVVPHMLDQGWGRIITVASIAALRTRRKPGHAYTASKAAVIAFTKTLAVEFAAQGIRANCIVPGAIETPVVSRMFREMGINDEQLSALVERRAKLSPTGKQGSPWDVAKAALFLASDDSSYVNGLELIVDGGFVCLAPE
jgi:NAD(P)-dependent dehydrogenase (short-subunit alcohol dehydrogenase family)